MKKKIIKPFKAWLVIEDGKKTEVLLVDPLWKMLDIPKFKMRGYVHLEKVEVLVTPITHKIKKICTKKKNCKTPRLKFKRK